MSENILSMLSCLLMIGWNTYFRVVCTWLLACVHFITSKDIVIWFSSLRNTTQWNRFSTGNQILPCLLGKPTQYMNQEVLASLLLAQMWAKFHDCMNCLAHKYLSSLPTAFHTHTQNCQLSFRVVITRHLPHPKRTGPNCCEWHFCPIYLLLQQTILLYFISELYHKYLLDTNHITRLSPYSCWYLHVFVLS